MVDDCKKLRREKVFFMAGAIIGVRSAVSQQGDESAVQQFSPHVPCGGLETPATAGQETGTTDSLRQLSTVFPSDRQFRR